LAGIIEVSGIDRMEKMKLSALEDSNEIYLIPRVFSMGPSGTGLRIYLDPATLREQRKLQFRADKYVARESM
jgi:hypothetical protein